MSNYKTQDIEKVNGEDFLAGMANDKRELFKSALTEAVSAQIDKTLEETKYIELPPPSKCHKQAMNRLFGEYVGSSFIPFPEEDNM